ncbi:MAG: carboxypeptidase-like regulatory domain-containing protein, partial [Saprospiraceae bacterium]|nr:carboxypeptidase-like regulatory domain-containing protein [Saprospiraceae bacterium]
MRNYSTLLLLLTSLISFFSYSSNAQVKGIVTDEQNHPLAFATIYVENSTLGTTTNSDGNYELNLPKGKHTLIFQYIGYEKEKRSIELKSDKNYELNVQLKEQSVTLNELVIVANGEDPAYRIIRNAIKAKTANNIIYDSYSADVYTKGIQKILDAPVKIMGIEVGDLQGNLDTTRQGIVYLSESVSKLYFKKPDIYKEVMISSKVSGKDNGFSFNQASVLNFNFYNNHIDFQRSMLSPIADNALLYYNYRLEGSCYNENKNLIYKISVIPKLNTEPVFSGSIYIFDGSWKIHSLNLTTFAKNLQIPIIDSLNIKQVFVPHLQDDLVLFNSSISFGLNIFKFKIQGSFNAVFSNYKVDDILADSTAKYKKDLLTVLPNANKKDSTYWESIRPIPLTQEERIDYQRKDSINDVRTSKVYLDSTDKKANRFHFKDLVLGYQYNKTYKKEKFQIFSPLSTIGFNPIQGYYINLNSQYRKVFNEYYTRFYEVSNLLQYGFTDHKLRLSAKYAYNFNKIKYNRFEVETGQIVQQFNEENPVSILINPYYALFAKKNFLKLYEKSYLKSSYQQYLTDGLFAKCNVEYQTRKLLSNNTEHSFSNKDIP